jgi:hypothetical protein
LEEEEESEESGDQDEEDEESEDEESGDDEEGEDVLQIDDDDDDDEVAAAAADDPFSRYRFPKSSRGVKGRSGGGGSESATDVLVLAIEEQERAMKELRTDLRVLRQIEAAWSITEQEARAQGIQVADMGAIAAFDDEDVAKVREVIAKVAAMLELLERDFGKHMKGYQEAVAAMGGILRTRASVINKLDSTTGIFSRYPELAAFVSAKQHKLTEAMKTTERALLDGFAASLAKVRLAQGQIRRELGQGRPVASGNAR